ncbi:hypothetical protein [Actinospica robiniae]|uniref:Uncharacterized protein n=1 Tax=Actinospica robiniae DSM 44927 TaxID=479430 RepID=W9DZP0_9ACTN|nr:hypothetical protein [Actinospica robiniae]ETA71060.1 hypothetical protein ActroDRAFT_0081 [Actinospica robiniae DSM 44927]
MTGFATRSTLPGVVGDDTAVTILPAAEFAEQLAAAQAMLAWAEKHPNAACEYREVWAKHVRGMQAASARRTARAS